MDEVMQIPFYFESIIAIIAVLLFLGILRRHSVKKTELTKMLVIQFVFYVLAIIGSWASKLIAYFEISNPQDTNIILGYIFNLIVEIRVALACISVGIYFSYRFRNEIFTNIASRKQKQAILLFCIMSVAACLFLIGNEIFILIVYAIVFLYDLIVYSSLAFRTYLLSRRIENKDDKLKIISIFYMSLFFLGIFFGFLLDQVVYITTGWFFNIFYYFAWTSAISAMVSAYIGYLKPAK
jgi:hypothetical protein